MTTAESRCTCNPAEIFARPEGAPDRCPYCLRLQAEQDRAAREAAAEALQGTTAQFLALLGQFIGRYVILPGSESYLALSLFVLHTWAFDDAAHATPYIVIESPEKQSGKTRLLEVLELVCRNPLKSASITAAALFQSIDYERPTMLIDEADAIFGGKSERSEELRGVLNAGNMPGSPVIRGGKDGEPRRYDVFCPKVIAGIATGKLPDTIRDRSIVIPIDRKLRSEPVDRLRRREISGEVDALGSELEKWARQANEALEGYRCETMEQISDRLEEAWEPLLAIANLAGGEYPARARAAAKDLAGGDDDSATASHTLLVALRDVFGKHHELPTMDILTALNGNDDLPFGSWNDGNGIRAAGAGEVASPLPGQADDHQGRRSDPQRLPPRAAQNRLGTL